MKSLNKLILIGLLSLTASANAAVIELALLLDKSGSMGSDYATQYMAYNSIFNDDFYTNVIVANGQAGDELFVSAYTFGGSTASQAIVATSILNDADAAAFGAMFNLANFGIAGGVTPTGDALELAINDILFSGNDGDIRIIDISTDGVPVPNSQASKALAQATIASNNGIAVNAIGIGSVDTSFLNALTTNGDGFYVVASDISGFETALEQKLIREITGVPAPASLLLLGLGFIGLSLRRKFG